MKVIRIAAHCFSDVLKEVTPMRTIFNNKILFVALLLTVSLTGCGGGGDSGGGGGGGSAGAVCSGADCVPLGTAGDLAAASGYAIFANTGIHTDANASAITGNIAAGPGVTSTAITGFALNLLAGSPFSTSAQVSGEVYAFDYAIPTPTNVTTASTAMGAAYDDAAGRPAGVGPFLNAGSPAGTLNGQTLAHGTYTWTSNVNITGDITLSGSSTDVWIFQVAGTLDMAANKKIILSGGALPQNIFWQVSGAVTIGAGTHFEGIILGKTGITFGNLSSINGRLLAQTAVTLDATTVTRP